MNWDDVLFCLLCSLEEISVSYQWRSSHPYCRSTSIALSLRQCFELAELCKRFDEVLSLTLITQRPIAIVFTSVLDIVLFLSATHGLTSFSFTSHFRHNICCLHACVYVPVYHSMCLKHLYIFSVLNNGTIPKMMLGKAQIKKRKSFRCVSIRTMIL